MSVHYLKIINKVLKNAVSIRKQIISESQKWWYVVRILVDQAVLELTIKTVFCTFWSKHAQFWFEVQFLFKGVEASTTITPKHNILKSSPLSFLSMSLWILNWNKHLEVSSPFTENTILQNYYFPLPLSKILAKVIKNQQVVHVLWQTCIVSVKVLSKPLVSHYSIISFKISL